MKVLSIDVGIKNLAFCLFEKQTGNANFIISKWDIANVSEKETFKCCAVDKNISCNKPAKYKKNLDCFCLKHAKKQTFQIPASELHPTSIQKQKIQSLLEIAKKYGIVYDKSPKKAELVTLINQYAYNNYFQSIDSVNASKVDLIQVGYNIKTKFDSLFSNEETIDYVIIENQIGPIANRMKTLQGMIVQYFIMTPTFVEHIEFISAANKLKDFNIIEKTKYSERKQIGIQKCLEIISADTAFSEHIAYFSKHLKKDDLSDSFLQGLWFIKDRKL
jgi:hypothetical protein